MNNFRYFLILFFFSFNDIFAEEQIDFLIKFSPKSKDYSCSVRMIYQHKRKIGDQVIIKLPYHWADQYFITPNAISVENPHKLIPLHYNTPYLLIKIRSSSPIKLSYNLKGVNSAEWNAHQRIITSKFIYGPGYSFFAVPTDNIEDRLFNVSIDIPKDWYYRSSFGNCLQYNKFGNSQNILHTFHVASCIKPTLIHSKSGEKIEIFSYPQNIENSSCHMIRNIMNQKYDVFSDLNRSSNKICTIIHCDSKNNFPIAGTYLNNGVIISLPKGDSLLKHSHLLTHEFLHECFRIPTNFKGVEEEIYWFTEGFNEYVTWIMELHSGRSNLKEGQYFLNENLEDYFSSPAQSITNFGISKGFWKSSFIQDLPYKRGFLFALYLDGLIQSQNGSNTSFFNILKKVLSKGICSEKDLIRILAQLIDPHLIGYKFENLYNKHIKLGLPFPFSEIKKALFFDFHKIQQWTYEFNIASLISDYRLQGINSKNYIYKQGFRNGYQIEGYFYDKKSRKLDSIFYYGKEYNIKSSRQYKLIPYLSDKKHKTLKKFVNNNF